jgi:hypothetical protein
MTAARLLDDWGGLLDVTHPAIEHRPPSTAQAVAVVLGGAGISTDRVSGASKAVPNPAARMLKNVDLPDSAAGLAKVKVAPPADLIKPEMAHPADPLRQARISLFRGKGIAQAERLADLLTERDDTLDDRRACAECASLHDGRCLQGCYPVGEADIYTLHRCAGFKPEEVSRD